MPIGLSPAGWDLPALREQWRAARPFPHLVLDGLLPADQLQELEEACRSEPLLLQADEHFWYRASTEPPEQPALRALALCLREPALLQALGEISGRAVTRADARVYAYGPGCYLLPHTDCRPDDQRLLAFAWYLAQTRPLRGGALELFECGEAPGQAAARARRIEPVANRLVLFEVSKAALHQVREVTQGERFSLAGWFSA